MAFQLSPGVNVSEFDLTTIVPSVGTTEGAIAGQFNWGPANTIVTISNEVELADIFGRPDANNFATWFTAANFLSYARNLKVVRATNGTSDRNATIGSTTVLIQNQDVYNYTYYSPFGSAANTAGIFAARYPGDRGNGLRIGLFANGTNTNAWSAWTSNTVPYAEQFDAKPNTSNFVLSRGGRDDEMHIIVIDELGKFTGSPNTVLEKFAFVSKASDAKNDDGSSNYYVNVINDRSKFIYAINHANTANWGSLAANTMFNAGNSDYYNNVMTGGVTTATTDADLTIAYDKFKNAEEVDISLIMAGASSQTVAKHIVDNIAEIRRDCVAFISPPMANVVNQAGSETTKITAYRDTFNSSSYTVMDSNWKYQFDKYNNVYRWVPLNGDIAGLCVRTDFDRDPWYSPAGFNRGQIKNVIRLAWNPNKTQRDELYKKGVNPVVSFPGEGTILYGDKTLLARPSAFDRINVRRLFIVLEKAIARAAKYSLFEFNDEFTRAQFISLVEPYLRDVQGRRGIFQYRVVCDQTNNTPEVIDRNEFIGDIYIKPARSINFIQLNFVAVRTGVAFDEIVGKF
jgi:phage tail sheath protein FI